MKITRRHLRKIIREKIVYPRHDLGKSVADVDFPIVIGYGDRSEIAYNQDELEDILDMMTGSPGSSTNIPYALDSLDDMEPKARSVGAEIERFAEGKVKITKKQLRKIIKEAMNDDFYEFRHQEDQKDLEDYRADVVFEIIEANQGISGPELVSIALRNSVFGGAQAKDVHETLDMLLDYGDVRFNHEEDRWSTAR